MAAADEPRRSGRATKGQNKAFDDPTEASPKPKKATKAKASKKAAEPVEEENEEEGEETIRCVCGDNTDDEAGRKFIACDACEVWQHNVCMGVSLEDDEQPEHYFCEQCRPEEHKELLDAMARGEKLWEERQRAAKAAKKKGGKRGRKPGKTGRNSEVKPESSEPPSQETAPAPETGVKRKFEEEPVPAVPEPTNGGTPDTKTTTPAGRADKRRKSSAKDTVQEDFTTALVDISLLPKERHNVAVALAKLVNDGINDSIRSGTYKVPDGQTAESIGHRFGQLIEYELYMNHGVGATKLPQQYGSQFRAINANFKKNPTLLGRLLSKSLRPAELAVMSSQDMASEQLQKERERMKEEADKQAVMIREDEKPRVRRTHKGDEYVDESAGANAESIFTSKPVRRRDSEMEVDGASSPRPAGTAGSPRANVPTPIETSRGSISDQRRQSSQNFDINNVWAKTAASPDTERPSSRPAPPTNGAMSQPQQNKPTGDADIDRLLADDDADDTYSPADVKPGDQGVIWQGKLSQQNVSSLTVSARFVAGNDFSRFQSWTSFMPKMLEIEGRLERSKADEYMCDLQWSKKSDVSVLALTPYEDRAAFETIFAYFHSRGRYAVAKKGHGCSELIKDLYISPVGADEKPPPHIDLLDYCALTFPNPEKVLLLTIVVNKPASWDQADAAMPIPDSSQRQAPAGRMSLPGGPAASPINPSGPQFSPAPAQGFTPDPSAGQGAFPPNPYGAQPLPPQQSHPQFTQNAIAIIGPYLHCPVAQQILAATKGVVQDVEATNMRDIFEKEPRAREDMYVFSAVLRGEAPPPPQQQATQGA